MNGPHYLEIRCEAEPGNRTGCVVDHGAALVKWLQPSIDLAARLPNWHIRALGLMNILEALLSTSVEELTRSKKRQWN
jgi:hypothetical protein